MGLIVTPNRFTSQPQYPAQIDRNNPLTSGINWASNGYDLLRPIVGTASQIGGAFPRLAGPQGTYLYNDASAGGRAIQTNISGAGNLSFLAICMRANDTPTSGVSEVETVWHNRQAGGANYTEFNLGNGFGAAADINKPRISNTAGTPYMWINGASQAAINPAPTILTTGAFYTIIGTGTGLPVGDGNVQLLGNEATASFGVNGGVVFIVFWNRVLAAAEIASLSANPWQLFQAPPRKIWLAASSAAGLTATDTATGSDTNSIIGSITTADSATGAESFLISASIALADAAAGSDIASILAQWGFSDSATATDSNGISAAIPFADSGIGTDSASITANLPLSDSGTGADVFGITASVSATDAAIGSDTVSFTVTVALADASSGADSLNVNTGAGLAQTDPATGADSLGVLVTVGLSDAGSGTDAASVTASITALDSAIGGDALALSSAASLTDIGLGGDSVSITVTVSMADIGAGLDSLTVFIPGQVLLPNARFLSAGIIHRNRLSAGRARVRISAGI